MKLVLATNNSGKLREIKTLLAGLPVEVTSLKDYPGCPESEEPYETYEENARDKAMVVSNYCQAWALADDSGLEIDALQGRPGVFSARYAGEKVTYEDNNRKVLKELKGIPASDRGARFRCCMVLRSPAGEEFITQGELCGQITEEPQGQNGFGYDPIFWLSDRKQTLAQLSLEEKNQISHRTRALQKMVQVLKKLV